MLGAQQSHEVFVGYQAFDRRYDQQESFFCVACPADERMVLDRELFVGADR